MPSRMLMESSTRLMTDAATRAPASLVADRGNVVTCPLHGAQFDVTTGRKRSQPRLGSIPDMDKLPQSFLKRIEHSAKIIAEIKTYDQPTYEISVDGKSIKLKME